MQRALEQALDHAEYVIESAQQRPPKRKYSSSGKPSLYEKLYDIYVEECEKEPEVTEELRSNVNLLEKLVRRESLPCLVVNLYPGNEGYSLMLNGKNGSYSESIKLPYEERALLEYLDAEELPPALVDLLEKSPDNFFHRGCVIAEIRDYRQSSGREPPGYQSRHILLRPTMQTLVCDVQAITSDNQKWTQEDKLLLESQLILATAEPLCLDPSVSVACTENRLLYNKQKINTLPMKRSFKRYSIASLNRQEELSHCPPPPELRVLTSCKKIREDKTGDHYGLKFSEAGNCVDMWKQKPCDLAVPSEVDVEKYAKGMNSVKYDESQPTAWPTHELQGGSVSGWEEVSQSQTTNMAFLQSLNDPLISGKRRSPKKVRHERQMSAPHSSKDDHSGSFVPGTKNDTGRAVIQSEEQVQKNAECPVQLSPSSSASASLGQPSSGKETEQPKTGSGQSLVLGKGAKHLPPTIKLSVNTGKSSSGNSLPSQQSSSSHISPSPASVLKPPKIFQKSVEVSRVSTLPATTQSTAGSSKSSQVSAKSSGMDITKVVHSGREGQPSRKGSKPIQRSTTRGITPARIKPSQMPIAIKPGPLAAGIELGHQPIGIQPNPPPGGIKLGHQSKGIKPGPPPGGIKLGRKPIGIKPKPLPGGIKLDHQPAEINPRLLSGGINLGQLPTGNKPVYLPVGAQPSNVLPSIPPAPSQGGVQLIFKNASSIRPLTLFQIPPGSLILNTQQQAQQQPQQLQQQWLYQLAPQQQLQQPITSHLQQPVPQVPVQGLANQSMALSAPQATVINLNRMESFMQPQAVVLSQLGSAQNQPRPILPQQRFQLSALQPQQQLQPQPQQIQFTILQQPVAVTTVAAQTAQPHPPSESTARHSKGKMKRSTPNTQKS